MHAGRSWYEAEGAAIPSPFSTAGSGNGSWKAGPFEEDRTWVFYR